MSEQIETEKPKTSDEEYLRTGQELRHDIVNHLITDSSGKRTLPSDPDTLNVIKGMLKDIDSSIFTKRRVMVEEAGAENDRRAAELIEAALGRSSTLGTFNRADVKGTRKPVIEESLLPKFDITADVLSSVGETVDLDEITALGRAHFKGQDAED